MEAFFDFLIMTRSGFMKGSPSALVQTHTRGRERNALWPWSTLSGISREKHMAHIEWARDPELRCSASIIVEKKLPAKCKIDKNPSTILCFHAKSAHE